MTGISRTVRQTANYVANHYMDRMKPVALPDRKEPVYVNFVVHTEEIADEKIFCKFLYFAKKFMDMTGVKCVSCIPTPECPAVKAQLFKYSMTPEIYGERVRRLALYADIGYHGHFYRVTRDRDEVEAYFARAYKSKAIFDGGCWQLQDGWWLMPVSHENYDFFIVREQILAEMDWFHENHLSPWIYTAGSWFLTPDIVAFIDEAGFKIDCSVRKYHHDSFGCHYMKEEDIPPRGEVFILPPAKQLCEVQSVFYPVQHPYGVMTRYQEMASYAPHKPLFVVFPSHERETIYFQREVFKHVEKLSHCSQFQWLPMQEYIHKIRELETSHELYRIGS